MTLHRPVPPRGPSIAQQIIAARRRRERRRETFWSGVWGLIVLVAIAISGGPAWAEVGFGITSYMQMKATMRSA